MKKIIILFAVILFGTAAFAQQLHITQFATLTHNDTVTGVWYGPTAFSDAHNAAEHGDIITLSPGTFNSTNITKAVTIRGHGMYFDSIANTSPTIINGHIKLDIPNLMSQGQYLTLEGIFFSGNLAYNELYYAHFRKCRFHAFRSYTTVDYLLMSNPVFSDCIIEIWDGTYRITNAMFTNCIILNSWVGGNKIFSYWGGWYEANNYLDCGISQDVYYNCIINLPPAYTQYKRMIVNSITFSNDTTQSNSANVSNTIGIQDSLNYFVTPISGDNINLNGFETLFKTFRGTYTEGETFELTSQAAATYLGSDNTQVGIYGGSTPFNPKSTDMRIMKVSPAHSSNGNRQLIVNVQLRAQ